jgi:hypothetical protein
MYAIRRCSLVGVVCISALLSYAGTSEAAYTFSDGDLSGEVTLQGAAFLSNNHNSNFGLGKIDFQSGALGKKNNKWEEYYLKPGVTFQYAMAPDFKLLGGASLVSAWTEGDGDAGGYTRGGAQNTSLEELYGGVQAGDWKVTVGNQNFLVGNGFIVMDGHLDLKGDGAYFIAPRTAFRDSAIVSWQHQGFSAQAFSLRTDDHAGDLRLSGGNIDYSVENRATLGAMALKVDALDSQQNQITPRDGMTVYNLRVLNLKCPPLPGMVLNGEYAVERGSSKGVTYDGKAWYASADYSFADLPLTPTIGYRYAYFSGGDNASNGKLSGWDPLAKGYTDWGTWVIGDIVGNYLLYGSNQKVNTYRVKTTLAPGLTLSAQYHQFDLDSNNYFGIPVTSKRFANETGIHLDYYATEHIYTAAAYNWVTPLEGARQALGNKKFDALEFYVGYRF